MTDNTNGALPSDDLEANLRRAAEGTDAAWSEREKQIRDRLENRTEASRQASDDQTSSLIEQFERQTTERSERVLRNSEHATEEVGRHLENLRAHANALAAQQQEHSEQTLFGKVRGWWMGLGKRKPKSK